MNEAMAVLGFGTALSAAFAAGAIAERLLAPKRGVVVVDHDRYAAALAMVNAERRQLAEVEARCEAAEAALYLERQAHEIDDVDSATAARMEMWLRENTGRRAS